MSAFDSSAFDAAAFDADGGIDAGDDGTPGTVTLSPASAEYVARAGLRVLVSVPQQISVPLSVSVSDAQVFESEMGAVHWSVHVSIGGVDVSARLSGQMVIEAEEDSARIASLDIVPTSPAQLMAFDGAGVAIDVAVSGGGYSASRRRFTGVVESVTFSPAARVASLRCRDGYQDRIRAAGSEMAVRALLGGLDTVSSKILPWNFDEPDAAGFFSGALDTVLGATCIDGAGSWRVFRWDIGVPVRVYTAADMFYPGPTVETAQRAFMPQSIVATLSHRFHRLHNAEVSLTWTEPPRSHYLIRFAEPPLKSMVQQAIDGLGEWVPKGLPKLISPAPGSYPVLIAPITAYYNVHETLAPILIRSLEATLYRRWYQEVERRYTVTIEMGGMPGVIDSINRAMKSDFDAAAWESGRRSESQLGVFVDNAPAGYEESADIDGYAALDGPWPPQNGSVDHFGDMSSGDVEHACRHVVAEATRRAASAARRQRVSVDRPVDLRLELGEVIAVDSYGVQATGQVSAWTETYDLDVGSCIGSYVMAAPNGSGDEIGFSADVSVPGISVVKALLAPVLGNHIGADLDTPADFPSADTLSGYLYNTLASSDFHDPDAPVFQTQFRIVMPEIPAQLRDPAVEDVAISAAVRLPGAGLKITW